MHQLRLPGARGIPDNLWTSFCKVIQELKPHIEELHISQASLSTVQLTQLFEALSAEDLKTIEIFSANLEDDIVDSLCKLISKSLQLEQLKLSDNKLTHKGLEQISYQIRMAICQGSRIKTLHLGGNKCGPTTIQTICKNIQGMTCIQSLGLRNSQIETEDQLNAVGALLAHPSCGIHDL